MKIYTVGYQSGWDLERLQESLASLKATVVDVRLKAWSKDPQWQIPQLDAGLTSYRHVSELGNLNYKGGPVRIQNATLGIAKVSRILEHCEAVILLCACWSVQTCHRTVVAKALADAIGETEWKDLGRPRKTQPAPDPQLSLF